MFSGLIQKEAEKISTKQMTVPTNCQNTYLNLKQIFDLVNNFKSIAIFRSTKKKSVK